MTRRQTMPCEWLIADTRLGERLWIAVRTLPRGSGVLVLLHDLRPGERERILRRLRRLAALRSLTIVDEGARAAARVHDLKELRRALLARAGLVLLSPVYPTRSHPEWRGLPRMQAAALARLANRRLLALGGMDERRFGRVQRLGFAGWAGIDAWVKLTKLTRQGELQ